ncbi:putative major facilitator superfamily transporter protein [Diplocarpon rosae]|nr:putative major facilitator superfamily transporter protein [Diplocarpon rosae]
MSDKLHIARIVSSIAATTISLACGSNYVYSAWGPQYAERLKLSSTEQNLIGLSGNLGMYSLGIPVGILVDAKGPRLALIMGALLLGGGYFPLHRAYDQGSGPLPLLCMFSFFTGLGGCAAFAAAIKTSALNWPHHRGTATGFPVAAFGLSAFFFSMFAHFVMPGSTGDFLMLLACGTSGIVTVGFFFLRVIPHPHYTAIPTTAGRGRADSNRLHRSKSEEAKRRAQLARGEAGVEVTEGINTDTETSSLMSKTSSSPGDEEYNVKDRAHRVDIRGLKMIATVEFWQLFCLMGILTGVGLMTINNIGNDTKALWRHWDETFDDDSIAKRQAMHVSTLSVCSFIGRLMSGVGSDFLAKVLHASRWWCLTIASLVLFAAQCLALSIENPHYLILVSSLTGIAYGFLFGCFPSMVADAFGVHGLSTNWGCMTISPVISGNIFNLFYGSVYDRHSILRPGGERECTDGLACYRSAYVVTFFSCLVGLAMSLWSIWYTSRQREKEEKYLQGREA